MSGVRSASILQVSRAFSITFWTAKSVLRVVPSPDFNVEMWKIKIQKSIGSPCHSHLSHYWKKNNETVTESRVSCICIWHSSSGSHSSIDSIHVSTQTTVEECEDAEAMLNSPVTIPKTHHQWCVWGRKMGCWDLLWLQGTDRKISVWLRDVICQHYFNDNLIYRSSYTMSAAWERCCGGSRNMELSSIHWHVISGKYSFG